MVDRPVRINHIRLCIVSLAIEPFFREVDVTATVDEYKTRDCLKRDLRQERLAVLQSWAVVAGEQLGALIAKWTYLRHGLDLGNFLPQVSDREHWERDESHFVLAQNALHRQ